jgi:hypothetical protein
VTNDTLLRPEAGTTTNPQQQASQATAITVASTNPLAAVGIIAREASNFPKEAEARWQLLSLATGATCEKADLHIGKPFEIQWWYAHEIELEHEESGELRQAMRVVLISPKKQAIGFVSEGIFRSLRNLVDCFGSGELKKPIRVIIRQGTGKNNRRFYSLEAAN